MKYDWKISLKKAAYGFAMAAVPAGLYGMLPILNEFKTLIDPEKAMYVVFVVALLTFIANWLKHKN